MATPALVITAPQGRYEIIRRLAVGGMAEVFLARQSLGQGVERVVVLKRVLPNLLAEPEFIELFLSEGRLATQLTHPNIVQIFEVGTTTLSDDTADAGPFMSMEYLEGADLRTLLREAYLRGEKLGVPEAVGIVAQAAHGLGYAHRKTGLDGKPLGVVHRDISPHNVFVTLDGVTKVLDFGIAKSAAQRIVTRKNVMKGKLGYMAPEQVLGRTLDKRTDLFAIGILLWEALTTERLYLFDSDAETVDAILRHRPRRPSDLNPRVPRELDAITLKLLEQDPARRYQHAEEVAGELERVLHGLGCTSPTLMLARRVQALVPGAAAGASSPAAPPTGATPRDRTASATIAGASDADDEEPGFGDHAVDSLLEDAETTSLAAPPPDADLLADDERLATPPTAARIPVPRAPAPLAPLAPADRTRTAMGVGPALALAPSPPAPPVVADRTRTVATPVPSPPPAARRPSAPALPAPTPPPPLSEPPPRERTVTAATRPPHDRTLTAAARPPLEPTLAAPPPVMAPVVAVQAPSDVLTVPASYAPAAPSSQPSAVTLALLGALAGLAALGVAWLAVGGRPGTASTAASVRSSGAATAAATVSVRVVNAPPGARARLDGVEVPLAFALARGTQPRRLELIVGSDVVAALAITPERDVHIEFPPPPPPPPPAGTVVARAPDPPAIPPPPETGPSSPGAPVRRPGSSAATAGASRPAPRGSGGRHAAPPPPTETPRTNPHRTGTLGHDVSREYP